ncbi:uncharacterized protein LOC143508311 [Brachyhypopomus gauderio]|uniref:uncharacterized protein LOC143508311 n=1 Tax=Brachyhypopomus gauderio TaxID=698409 RepID=UPI0040424855
MDSIGFLCDRFGKSINLSVPQLTSAPQDPGQAPRDAAQATEDAGQATEDAGQAIQDVGQAPQHGAQAAQDAAHIAASREVAAHIAAAEDAIRDAVAHIAAARDAATRLQRERPLELMTGQGQMTKGRPADELPGVSTPNKKSSNFSDLAFDEVNGEVAKARGKTSFQIDDSLELKDFRKPRRCHKSTRVVLRRASRRSSSEDVLIQLCSAHAERDSLETPSHESPQYSESSAAEVTVASTSTRSALNSDVQAADVGLECLKLRSKKWTNDQYFHMENETADTCIPDDVQSPSFEAASTSNETIPNETIPKPRRKSLFSRLASVFTKFRGMSKEVNSDPISQC